MTVKIGLDLGYANYTVSDVTAGVYREPSVALVDQGTHHILRIGTAASDSGEGEGQAGAILVRPFKNGMLYSSELTGEFIDRVLRPLHSGENKLRCFVGIPGDFHPKQTAALAEMIRSAGADEVFAVKRGLAALIGGGYSPMISAVSVNVGASHTEIMVLHEGKILNAVSAPVGGEEFDRAVKDHIAEQGDFNISLYVASRIKERLGAVWEGKPSESITIDGTLSLTGSKIRLDLSTEDIVGAFRKPLASLIDAVADVIKKIPSDLVSPIFANGIILSGGGAELYGLPTMLSHVLGIQVHSPQFPIDCVGRGLAMIGGFVPSRLRSDRDITDAIPKYYRDMKKT